MLWLAFAGPSGVLEDGHAGGIWCHDFVVYGFSMIGENHPDDAAEEGMEGSFASDIATPEIGAVFEKYSTDIVITGFSDGQVKRCSRNCQLWIVNYVAEQAHWPSSSLELTSTPSWRRNLTISRESDLTAI